MVRLTFNYIGSPGSNHFQLKIHKNVLYPSVILRKLCGNEVYLTNYNYQFILIDKGIKH